MNRYRVLTMLTVVAVWLAGSQLCLASSITLISSGGGVNNNGLTIDANSHVHFLQNEPPPPSGSSPSPPGSCVVPSTVPSGCRYGAPLH
jgi:hypothetical protein